MCKSIVGASCFFVCSGGLAGCGPDIEYVPMAAHIQSVILNAVKNLVVSGGKILRDKSLRMATEQQYKDKNFPSTGETSGERLLGEGSQNNNGGAGWQWLASEWQKKDCILFPFFCFVLLILIWCFDIIRDE